MSVLEEVEKEFEKEGFYQPFDGEKLLEIKCYYGEERKEDGTVEGWLVNDDGIKVCRIGRRQLELIKEFTEKGV